MAAVQDLTRRRNRRGEGGKLQDEIIAAAGAILEETGQDEAVTLRAVARRAGVTAPALYAHFTDREHILCTVVARTFTDLAALLQSAAETQAQPVPRFFAVCRAYLDFATQRPGHYRVLFERHRLVSDVSAASDVAQMVGADAFGVLLTAVRACIDAGCSAESSAEAAATRVWIGLHGQATLRASLPWFPWPDRDELLDDIATRLGDLRVAK